MKSLAKYVPLLLLIGAILACGDVAEPTLVESSPGDDPAAEPTGEEDQGGEDGEITTDPTEEPEPEDTGPTIYQVGDIITAGDMVFTLVGWQFSEGNELIQPEAGNIYVGVDIVISNQGSEPFNIAPMLTTHIKDSTNQIYNPGPFATGQVGDGLPNKDVNPGERLRGQIGFQVNGAATGLVFTLDPNLWAGGKLFIELGDTPTSVDIPADFPADQPQTAFAVGDTVALGDMSFVVNEVLHPNDNPVFQPAPGTRFVVLDVTFTNNAAQAVNFAGLGQPYMKDSAGQIYDSNLGALLATGGAVPSGEYAPGESIRGQIGFQVPESASGLFFVLDAGGLRSGKALVALGE